jgi:hypothetical protein
MSSSTVVVRSKSNVELERSEGRNGSVYMSVQSSTRRPPSLGRDVYPTSKVEDARNGHLTATRPGPLDDLGISSSTSFVMSILLAVNDRECV